MLANMPKKMYAVLIVSIIICILTAFSIALQSYFHTKEINLLVEKAMENNLEFELVIHNELTNAYSFEITEK